MGGGGSVQPAPVDPAQQALEAQQTALLAQQTNILQGQAQSQKAIAPFLYQSLGLNPTFDSNGNLTSLTQNPQTAQNASLQQTITGEQLQQEQQALSGNLPVNPLVTQTLNTQQQQLNTRLSQNLGPGYAASTPGQQAQNSFNTNQAGVIQAANTGQMTLDQQLAALGTQNYGQTLGQVLQGTMGINNLGFQTAGAFGAGAQGINAAYQPLEFQQQQTLQANMANAQLGAQQSAGEGQLAGSLAGAAAMALILA